ncbi:transcriptional regulator, DeoR family [Ruegeria halocynthiae]|uniref:Transcriptional regulator, DeoR family n=1 Tax=Ruegeria halocynthiae TaxID=985054 RepID=A0A1H2RTT7_9RHOB|nr:DeoR/GlpR family DNA-binding transcription regulator [Ruegeria halocynthiae]SDW22039.1 transcriptional regulator, DeoR family [Ruegeria halocynthiae]
MSKTEKRGMKAKKGQGRVKKSDRRREILLELKLRPHVRISELAHRFNVSAETVRRDFDALSHDGLISRAHGGASAPTQGRYPTLDERTNARLEEREKIGKSAADLIQEGETVMIDSGSTTIEMARMLAYRGTICTVITNSVPVAMTLGHTPAEVILCPGEYLAAESATIGTETLEFLSRFNVDCCMIGSSGFSEEGPSETVRGFAAVKRMMLARAETRHLLIDSEKFGRKDLTHIGDLDRLDSIITDTEPTGDLLSAIKSAGVEILVAEQPLQRMTNRGQLSHA